MFRFPIILSIRCLDVESWPSPKSSPTCERDLARKDLARPIRADRGFAMIKRHPYVIDALDLLSISISHE